MANALDRSFVWIPNTFTHTDWRLRYQHDLSTLHSLAALDPNSKIYYDENDGRFYNSSWNIASNIRKWMGNWAADYLAPYEDALYRYLWKLSYKTTMEGIRQAKHHIDGTLAIAVRMIEKGNQLACVKIDELEWNVSEIKTNLKNASSGLFKIQNTYESSEKKKEALKPVLDAFSKDLEQFVDEVLLKISAAREKMSEVRPLHLRSHAPLPPPEEPQPMASSEEPQLASSPEKNQRPFMRKFAPGDVHSPAVPKIPRDPAISFPSLFPFPGSVDDQLEFNDTLDEKFLGMKKYVEEHQTTLVKKSLESMNASTLKSIPFKRKLPDRPWTIVVTKEGQMYFHLHTRIVPKGEGGAHKTDKRAYSVTLHRDIAKLSTKFLANSKRDAELIALAKREEAILKKLSAANLPHVVKIRDIIWKRSGKYIKHIIYTDLGIHGHLKSNCARLAGDPAKLRKILAQISTGLAGIHDLGIVHRDLKPKNIILDENDKPELIDYGLSCNQGDSVCLQGTPAYMAPEIIRDSYEASAPADIWAFGILMYEILTNPASKTPWPWQQGVIYRQQLYRMLVSMKTAPFPEPDPKDEWMHLCWECLQIDPLKRPTAQQIRDRLNKLVIWEAVHDHFIKNAIGQQQI